VFDAADASIDVYVEQFRYFLGACGFCEKSIVEALGEQ
jgi:DNA relaxase NicK